MLWDIPPTKCWIWFFPKISTCGLVEFLTKDTSIILRNPILPPRSLHLMSLYKTRLNSNRISCLIASSIRSLWIMRSWVYLHLIRHSAKGISIIYSFRFERLPLMYIISEKSYWGMVIWVMPWELPWVSLSYSNRLKSTAYWSTTAVFIIISLSMWWSPILIPISSSGVLLPLNWINPKKTIWWIKSRIWSCKKAIILSIPKMGFWCVSIWVM